MPEMKTLNGYEVVDAQAREDIKELLAIDFATETYVDNAIDNIYIPEVDLSEHALKSEIPTKVSQLINDKNFITEIPGEYVTNADLNAKGYATESYVNNKVASIPTVDLTPYAKKSDIPDLTPYVKKSEVITEIPDEYITESELAGKGYVTESFVTNKIAEAKLEGEGSGPIDLSGYATKDDLQGFIKEIPSEYVTESELNKKGYLTEHQSLADYALKSEIPDVSDYITDVSHLATKESIPTKVSQLTNDKNYLTSIPSEYITDSELNAKGFQTVAQVNTLINNALGVIENGSY